MRKTVLIALLALLLALALPGLAQGVNARELAYAYLDSTEAYLLVGKPVTMEIIVPSTQGLTFEFTLYFTADRVASDNMYDGIDKVKASTNTTYTFTPDKTGQYMVEVYIMDADFRGKKVTSEPFYCYDPSAESDPETLPGKVQAIVAELNAQNLPTEYERALWLHDWLTGNAEYDEPMTIHTPEGVLLQGEGVCESYALAYQMLLHEAGIDSLYVTGYSRAQAHAWNIVNIDGQWVYVDTTWDDPIGGEEGYDYFGMNDTLMGRDHDWSFGNINVPPAAETLDHNYLLKNGATPFHDEAALDALLRDAFNSKQPSIWYTYHGSDPYFDVSYTIEQWMKKNAQQLFVRGYQFGGSKFSGRMEVEYGESEGVGTFKDDDEFNAAMDVQLKAKEPVIKMQYTGDDQYFDFGRYIRKWLAANSRAYMVKTYEYTYLPMSGEIKLTYGDYTGYQTFADTDALNALLQQFEKDKPANIKLYYTGTDEFYNLRSQLNMWLSTAKGIKSYQGTSGPFEADMNIEWQ